MNAAIFLHLIFGFFALGAPQVSYSSKTIAVGKGPDALFLTPDERYLYVANVEDTIVSVIDTHTDRVVKTLNTVDYPWGFARVVATNWVAVSGWGQGVDLVDFTRHRIERSRRYDLHLGGIAATRDGGSLYVVATDSNEVLKLAVPSLEIQARYATGQGPDGIGLSADEKTLFVTDTRDGTISMIDVRNGKRSVLKVGGKPELVHASHDRRLLFISNFFENKVHVLDTASKTIVHEITGLDGPEEAVLSADESTLYVVSFNRSEVLVYDAKTYRRKALAIKTGNKPIGVAPLSRLPKLYVSNYGDNTVTVVEFRTPK